MTREQFVEANALQDKICDLELALRDAQKEKTTFKVNILTDIITFQINGGQHYKMNAELEKKARTLVREILAEMNDELYQAKDAFEKL